MRFKTVIGMTEAGDAGRDLSWYDKINDIDGAILITKYGQDPAFQAKVMEFIRQKPCIVHFGCTGWGGTPMEPGNVDYKALIDSIRKFIDDGFPPSNIVLRVDPIFPTPEGLERASAVFEYAKQVIPEVTRYRISIYDDYHAAREEMIKRGYQPIDGITKWKTEMERRPRPDQVKAVAEMLIKATSPATEFELCAEPELQEFMPNRFHWFGCCSQRDCDIMGIDVPKGTGINGQQRFGCRCLRLKTELLVNKRRCPNNCAYCYWGK